MHSRLKRTPTPQLMTTTFTETELSRQTSDDKDETTSRERTSRGAKPARFHQKTSTDKKVMANWVREASKVQEYCSQGSEPPQRKRPIGPQHWRRFATSDRCETSREQIATTPKANRGHTKKLRIKRWHQQKPYCMNESTLHAQTTNWRGYNKRIKLKIDRQPRKT